MMLPKIQLGGMSSQANAKALHFLPCWPASILFAGQLSLTYIIIASEPFPQQAAKLFFQQANIQDAKWKGYL